MNRIQRQKIRLGDRVQWIHDSTFKGETGVIVETVIEGETIPPQYEGDFVTVKWDGGEAVTRSRSEYFEVIDDQ